MSTRFTRVSGASPYSPTSTTNATKYQTDSAATSPRVAMNSRKVDDDVNYVVDALNLIDDDLNSIVAGALPSQTGNANKVITTDGSSASWNLIAAVNLASDAVETAKIKDANVTFAKLASAAVANQSEAEAGTATDKLMTPQRATQNVQAQRASQAEAQAGTATTTLMTPLRTAEAIAALYPKNTPAFRVYRNSAQTITASSETKIAFDTEVHDATNAFDAATDNDWNPQTAGRYALYGMVRINAIDTDKVAILRVKKNTTSIHTVQIRNNRASDDDLYLGFYAEADLNGSSDAVTVTIEHDSTGTVQVDGGPSDGYFAGFRLLT